jgi:hypothetical protein
MKHTVVFIIAPLLKVDGCLAKWYVRWAVPLKVPGLPTFQWKEKYQTKLILIGKILPRMNRLGIFWTLLQENSSEAWPYCCSGMDTASNHSFLLSFFSAFGVSMVNPHFPTAHAAS